MSLTPAERQIVSGRRRESTRQWFPAGALVVSIALWALSVARIDVTAMTDIGLVSVLPVIAFVSLAVLTIGFVASVLRSGGPAPIWRAYVVTFIAFFHGTPALLYGTLRYPWGWKHVGIIDYIQRFGEIDPNVSNLSIYHNWPGFFSLNAFLTQAAGLDSALTYASWSPLFFNLVAFLTLLFLMRMLTDDRRVVAFAIWFYFLTSWVGQDYFAPQALTFVLYLVVVAIALRWYRSGSLTIRFNPTGVSAFRRLGTAISNWIATLRRRPLLRFPIKEAAGVLNSDYSRLAPEQRAGLLVFVLLLMLVVASSHQLSPVMTIMALVGLVVFGLVRPWSLPVAMAGLTLLWALTGAVSYALVNLDDLRGTWQDLANVQGTFVDLGQVSSGQVLVSWVTRALTGVVALLAAAGAVRSYRRGTWHAAAIVLTAAPLSLAVLSAYGTEILFRVYMFALPFAAFLTAVLLIPGNTTRSANRTRIAALAMSSILLVGFVFAYYGNEQLNYFTPAEVAAADYLYAKAPKGALIVEGSRNYPGLARNHEYFVYVPITREPWETRVELLADPVPRLWNWLTDDRYPASYLIITRSQKLQTESLGQMPPGGLDSIESALLASSEFEVWFSNEDATIFVAAGGGFES